MYHYQLPPPDHKYNAALTGLTWVDLVFPFFLFSMGAAIPLALGRRLRAGEPAWRLVLSAFQRLLMLGAFGIYIEHVRPWSISGSPTVATWLTALLAGALAVMALARIPSKWPVWACWAVHLAGWAGAVGLLAALRFMGGPGFSKDRSDAIIMILATAGAAGMLVWLATARSLLGRLGVAAAVLLFWLSSTVDGSWAKQAMDFDTGFGWFTQQSFLLYLLVVIPGTIIGDILAEQRPSGEADTVGARHGWFALAAFSTIPATLVVLFSRQLPWLWVVPFVVAALLLVPKGDDARDNTVRKVLHWGMALLLLGLVAEPFQSGIKKDPPTISYMLTASGLAAAALASFMSLERLWPRSRAMRFGATTGRNPMVAYVAMGNVVPPIWVMSVGPWLEGMTPGPYLGLGRALFATFLLGVFVSICTRYRIQMRA